MVGGTFGGWVGTDVIGLGGSEGGAGEGVNIESVFVVYGGVEDKYDEGKEFEDDAK